MHQGRHFNVRQVVSCVNELFKWNLMAEYNFGLNRANNNESSEIMDIWFKFSFSLINVRPHRFSRSICIHRKDFRGEKRKINQKKR